MLTHRGLTACGQIRDMSEQALIGVTQVLATVLVFVAVESRLAPLPKGNYDQRGRVFLWELVGLGLVWFGILMGLAQLVIPGASGVPIYSQVILFVASMAAAVMAFASICRVVWGRLAKSVEAQHHKGDKEDGRDTHDE